MTDFKFASATAASDAAAAAASPLDVQLRRLVANCVGLSLFPSAAFYGEKLITLNNGI
jgi:hypothetical protein